MAELAQSNGAMSTSSEPSTRAKRTINVGTRRSPLARAQTDIIVGLLKQAWPDAEFQIHAIQTMGDKNQITALYQFNAKSLWTYELEAMLLKGELDFIVHSLKDVPTQLPEHTILGPSPARADPHDAVVMHPKLTHASLASLPAGAVIGTSSVRRIAQLMRLYPHLKFQSVRGSVGTRLQKLDAEDSPYSAIVVAAAGLIRVDLGHRITSYLSSTSSGGAEELPVEGQQFQGVLHAVGQGALGIQLRENDAATAEFIAPLKDKHTTVAVLAERSLMRTLEGGCSVPIGVETAWKDDGTTLEMQAIVVSLDGTKSAYARHSRSVADDHDGEDAGKFGMEMAKRLLDKGAGAILDKITMSRAENVDEQPGS